jgi:hypothetical protein
MAGIAIGGELLLEPPKLVAEDVPVAGQDPGPSRRQLAPDLIGNRRQIVERDAQGSILWGKFARNSAWSLM